MRNLASLGLVRVCLAVFLLVLSDSAGAQLRYRTGQNIAPVYEGFERNADGTYSLWFGYFNRNHEEFIDLPIGPDNTFEPGPADRGQPTHFLPRRHRDLFKIVVPADFGNQKLVWRLTVRGQSESVTASLKADGVIDRKAGDHGTPDEPVPNTPPVATAEPAKQTIQLPATATVTVRATDDGKPRQRQNQPGLGDLVGKLTVTWSKYRGPGTVTFSPAKADVAAGTASTSVSFSEPGEYMIDSYVDDGSGPRWATGRDSGFHCCWTNIQTRVTVLPPAKGK